MTRQHSTDARQATRNSKSACVLNTANRRSVRHQITKAPEFHRNASQYVLESELNANPQASVAKKQDCRMALPSVAVILLLASTGCSDTSHLPDAISGTQHKKTIVVLNDKASSETNDRQAKVWVLAKSKLKGPTAAKNEANQAPQHGANAEAADKQAGLQRETEAMKLRLSFIKDRQKAKVWVDNVNFKSPDLVLGLITADLSSVDIDSTLVFSYLNSFVSRVDTVTLPSAAHPNWHKQLAAIRGRNLKTTADHYQRRHPELSVDEGQRLVQSLGNGLLAAAASRQRRDHIFQEVLNITEAISEDTMKFDQLVLAGRHDADITVTLLKTSPNEVQQLLDGIELYLSEQSNRSDDSAKRALFRERCLVEMIKDIEQLAAKQGMSGVVAMLPRIVDILKRFNAPESLIDRFDQSLDACNWDEKIFAKGVTAFAFANANRTAAWKNLQQASMEAKYGQPISLDMTLAAKACASRYSNDTNFVLTAGQTSPRSALSRVMVAEALFQQQHFNQSMAVLTATQGTKKRFAMANLVLDMKVQLVRSLMTTEQKPAIRQWVEKLPKNPFDIESQYDRPVLQAAIAASSKDERDWLQAFAAVEQLGPHKNFAYQKIGLLAARAGHLKIARHCLRKVQAGDSVSAKDIVLLQCCIETLKGQNANFHLARRGINKIPAKAVYSRAEAEIHLAVGTFMTAQPSFLWSTDAANVNTMTPLNRLSYRLRILSDSRNSAF